MFGTPSSTPAFGTPSSTPAFGTPSFGSPSTPAFGAPSSKLAFGTPSSTTAFGTPSSTPSFGAPSSTPAVGIPSSTPTFGTPSALAFGSSSFFPQQQQQSPFSLFPQQQQQQTSSFQPSPGFANGQITMQMAPAAPVSMALAYCDLTAIIEAYKGDPGNPKYSFRHLLLSVTDPAARVKPFGSSDIMRADAIGKLEGMQSLDRERLWPQLVQDFKDLFDRLKFCIPLLAAVTVISTWVLLLAFITCALHMVEICLLDRTIHTGSGVECNLDIVVEF